MTAPNEEFNQECIGDFSKNQQEDVNYMRVQNLNFGNRNFNPTYRPQGRFYTQQNVPQGIYFQPKQQYV